jgi:hypothetical protein
MCGLCAGFPHADKLFDGAACGLYDQVNTMNARRPYQRTGLYIRTKAGLRERDRRVEKLTRRMYDVLDLNVSDRPAVRAWCQLELLCCEIYGRLRKTNLINAQGQTPRLVDDYRKLRTTQLMFAREIGLTPAARLAPRRENAALNLGATTVREADGQEVERLTLIGLRTVWAHLEKQKQEEEAVDVTAGDIENAVTTKSGSNDYVQPTIEDLRKAGRNGVG